TLTALLMRLLTAGCATTPVNSAVCDATGQPRKALAEALIEDGDAQSQRAGLRLLDQMEARCG
uniref:hypothetical protein n=1 Tax=Paracoccus sp. TaxID=267 RepID=UPI0028A7959C